MALYATYLDLSALSTIREENHVEFPVCHCLQYYRHRQLSLLPSVGREMSSSLRAIRGEGVVLLIGVLYVCWLQTAGPVVRWRGHWMAA